MPIAPKKKPYTKQEILEIMRQERNRRDLELLTILINMRINRENRELDALMDRANMYRQVEEPQPQCSIF